MHETKPKVLKLTTVGAGWNFMHIANTATLFPILKYFTLLGFENEV